MKVIPTEQIEWQTVVANARAGHVQRKYVREGEILPGVGFASVCYNYVGGDSVFTAPRHHHQDALNAIWENVFRREASFPRPRYPQPILMDPDAFEYIKLDNQISAKVLGRFTERDLMISKIRWDDRAGYEMPADRTYCMFTNLGDAEVGGQKYGEHTVVWSDLGETVEVIGEPGTEALCIAFPPVQFAPDHAGLEDAG
jgi:hypothetical protein